MTGEEIINRFYNIWFRSPSKEEFVTCGGNLNFVISNYNSYVNMLKLYGYPKPNPQKIIKATHDDGRIFTGNCKEVAEELRCHVDTINNILNKDCRKDGWTLEVFPFDVEIFNTYKE